MDIDDTPHADVRFRREATKEALTPIDALKNAQQQ